MAIISFPVLLICLLLPDFLLGIFGPEFICGKQILIILCVGQFINVSTGSVGQILAMTNREKLLRISVLSGTVLNLLLNITLVPNFGMEGAAFAFFLDNNKFFMFVFC